MGSAMKMRFVDVVCDNSLKLLYEEIIPVIAKTDLDGFIVTGSEDEAVTDAWSRPAVMWQ